ncbi:unnamed protein product [Trifolium pratense]|uniref:Uncharacterized protein n=1 Tax=Trifolium pratense TaxID=57577 RepID=A0ACB0KYG4_TRIPR|nr:unnamed protein product [Trifolium pratense]
MEPMKQEEDGSMQQYCINHPTKKNPGGICAFCLQEKLGKLVSSSFPLPITTPSSSSSLSSPPSSSPSFRSQTLPSSSSSSLSIPPSSSSKHNHHMRSRLPFLIPKKNHKKTPSFTNMNTSANGSSDIVFKRSKSTTTPRRTKFLDDDDDVAEGDFNIRKRNRFWSFLYLSSKPSNSCNKKIEGNSNNSPRISTMKPKMCSLGRNCERVVEEDEEDEQVSGSSSGSGNSLEQEQRKVSRSRSVGCGSRSFSGDFFEKISTGFGDCTLRRVESQREGKGNKVNSSSTGNGNIQHCMKERVKCGGIFSGFMMMNSSSSSSVSSSSYWVSSSDDGRSRSSSWSWALASPMRAFSSKSTSKDNKSTSEKRNSPNLSAVPSLLIARG